MTSPHDIAGRPVRNPAISIGFLIKIIKTAIETSTVLGVDADLRAEWQDRVDHIAPFPTQVVIDPTSPTNATIEIFTAQENPGYFPGSTNPLDLYALWPGETVGVNSPKALRAIGARKNTSHANTAAPRPPAGDIV
jgi:alpha-L-fucosidase 2